MERGNTKHGPRLDNEMEHEVRGLVQGNVDTRVEEFRDPEPAGEDQPSATRTPAGYERGGAPPGMTRQDVEERSNLGRYIPLSKLPGEREDLIAGARDLLAPDSVLDRLASLPEGERYETVNQIWAALGGNNEERRT
jgi:hypothetical protein